MINLGATTTLSLFRQPAFQLGVPENVFVHGTVPPQVQDFAVSLIEFHEVPFIPFLQPAEISLDAAQLFGDI